MKNILLSLALLISVFSNAQSSNKTINNGGGTPGSGSTTSTGGSTEVGVTDGNLSVSLSGTANYNIPIEVPPGINGVVPQIGLSYSSQSGVGVAGYGWNISGLSTISRIPSTKYHDGVNDPVDFDALDRYALDGQRLIIKTGTYGVAGSTYQTENYSNVKITLIANVANNYFKVEYPDGSFAIYSSLNSTSLPTVYGITVWQNPQGLTINYTYTTTNNFLYPFLISYGSVGSNTINEIKFIFKNRTRIEQSYTAGIITLNDKILSQISVKGNGIAYRNYLLTHDAVLDYERLVSITEKSGDNSKSYNPTVFTYQETITTESITGLSSSTLLSNATIDSYYGSPINGDFDGNGDLDIITPSFPQFPSSTNLSSFTLYTSINDAITTSVGSQYSLPILPNYKAFEIVTIKSLSGVLNDYKLPNNDFWCVKGTTNGAGDLNAYKYDIYSRVSAANPVNLEYSKEFLTPSGLAEYTTIFGDFNGDGLSDIMLLPFAKGGAYAGEFEKVFFLNLDRRITSNYVKDLGLSNDLITNNKIVKTGDFNGDGKTDLILFVGAPTNKIYVYSLDDTNSLVKLFETNYNFTPRDTTLTTYPSYYYLNYSDQQYIQNLPNINIISDIAIGDFNGDGKSDFILPLSITSNNDGTFTYGKNVICYSTGINFVPEELPFFPYLFKKYIAVDFDTDGKTDLITYWQNPNFPNSPITLHYIKKLNNVWTDNVQTITNILNNQLSKVKLPMFTFSKQNNSKPELVLFNADNSANVSLNYFVNQNDFSNQKLLKNITLGNGVKETITYSPMTSDVYTPSIPIENYPNYDISGSSSGIKLVTQVERTSSTVYKKQLYKYYGATSNIEGLGFLGFRSILKTNWFADASQIISNVTNYSISVLDSYHNFSFRGAPLESYSVLGLTAFGTPFDPNNQFINWSQYSYNYDGLYDDTVSPLLPNKVFKLRNTSSQTVDGLQGNKVDVITVFDGYNNPLTKRTTISNDSFVESMTAVENYTYDNLPTASPYFIGRAKSKVITKTIQPSNDTSVDEELYTYNNNLLTQIQKRATNSGVTTGYITETNDYDVYGNIITKTLGATGETPRVSSFQYDAGTHRFLSKKIDIQSLATDYTYNLSNGLFLTETLPSNTGFPLITTYGYDTWGKKTSSKNYTSKIETYSYAYSTDGVVKTTKGPTGEDSSTIIILDDLGRKNHEGTKTIDGNWSYTSTYYNINDKPILVSQPYFAGVDGLGTFDVWNEMQYDIYGRLIQSNSLSTNDDVGKQTVYSYLGLSATENDGQKVKVTTKNPYGKVISVTETPTGLNPTTINYEYFANGNLKKTSTSGADTTIEQDGWGRKITLNDPSAGIYKYTYNNFGETKTEEVVGKGITTYTLDIYDGKVTAKTIVGTGGGDATNTLTNYIYDPTSKLLKGITFTDTTNSYTIDYTYDYDNYRRLNFSKESRAGFYEFQKEYTFDAYGRAEKEHFLATDKTLSTAIKSSDKWIKTIFKNGYKYQLYDMTSSTVVGTTKLWQTTTVNQQGKVLTATMGNGVAIANTYDVYGFPSQIKHDKTTTNIMTLNTSFEAIHGNLMSRNSNLFGTGALLWSENLNYDNFDRLTSYKDVAGIQTQSYASNGTITSNNIGSYAYSLTNTFGQVQPYSVSTITPPIAPLDVFNYYNNRMQTIGYNLFKSPVWIIEQGKENIDFEYNAQNGRSVMYYGDQTTTKSARMMRKFYSADGSMEIKRNITTNVVDFVTYIGGDGYSAPVVLKSDGTTKNYFYLHRDYQGSILAITNTTGAVVEKRWFDVWGSLIKYAGSNGVSVTPPTFTTGLFLDRGYTGHEHLLSVGLINMNGRIYDNKLHRFLQPDNNIQDPSNSQNYNRFGYCMNNPTKYTDPTGEDWGDVLGFLIGSYFSGVQASNGQLNPIKWDSNTWINAGLGGLSGLASNYANNYVNNNYANNPQTSTTNVTVNTTNANATQNNINYHPHVNSNYNNSAFKYAGVATGGLLADDIPTAGVGVVDDILIPFAWGIAGGTWLYENKTQLTVDATSGIRAINETLNPKGFKYVTYTKTNFETGLVYVGRSSGYGTPEQIVRDRDYNHHMDKFGYGKAELSVFITASKDGYGPRISDPAYWAIRGVEQLQIMSNREKGIDGNIRNGIGFTNDMALTYLDWGAWLLEGFSK